MFGGCAKKKEKEKKFSVPLPRPDRLELDCNAPGNTAGHPWNTAKNTPHHETWTGFELSIVGMSERQRATKTACIRMVTTTVVTTVYTLYILSTLHILTQATSMLFLWGGIAGGIAALSMAPPIPPPGQCGHVVVGCEANANCTFGAANV